ncbi:MAG: patatin-like phospholipase family protein [Spirochaetota bacterium]
MATHDHSTGARTALVLSGGGARGLAHLGVLHALQEQGAPPALLVGASFGSIAAAYFAAGYPFSEIRRRAGEFRLRRVVGIGIRGGLHLLSARKVLDMFGRDLPPRIEQLDSPLVVAALDIRNREMLFIDRGPLGEALLASSAFPGLLPPVRRGDRLLADGGFVNRTLIREARRRGGRPVIFADVSLISRLGDSPRWVALYRRLSARIREKPPPALPFPPSGCRPGLARTALAVLHAVEHIRDQLPSCPSCEPDVRLTPVANQLKPLRFNRAELGIRLGQVETSRRMAEIRALLEGREASLSSG